MISQGVSWAGRINSSYLQQTLIVSYNHSKDNFSADESHQEFYCTTCDLVLILNFTYHILNITYCNQGDIMCILTGFGILKFHLGCIRSVKQ